MTDQSAEFLETKSRRARGARPHRSNGAVIAAYKAPRIREQKLTVSGELPLDFMLRVMRDESAPQALRCQMAIAAAPYVHPIDCPSPRRSL